MMDAEAPGMAVIRSQQAPASASSRALTQEEVRLQESGEHRVHWKRWGPYLSERQWGTVREDYSPYGTVWDSVPHDYARSLAYRWGEDGIGGICDRHQEICFALALWNGRDPILKERLFGLSNSEGNHGEDVKEYYYYLDSTPTHSYMKFLYKYPQAEFPYARLIEENRRRTRGELEFELIDTGVFDDNRYFDVFVEYAKASSEEILIRITAHNRGPEAAEIDLLPTLWFRNTWSWGAGAGLRQEQGEGDVSGPRRPELRARPRRTRGAAVIEAVHPYYGMRFLVCEPPIEFLFTENETNAQRLYGVENRTRFVKDGINDFIVQGVRKAVNPAHTGTKAAAHYRINLAAGANTTLRLRFTDQMPSPAMLGAGPAMLGRGFERIFDEREREADEFYSKVVPPGISDEARDVQRQALAGMLWSKQFYHYDVRRWLAGDPNQPPPPPERTRGRNSDWPHLYNADVISVPDKWEYPWYAAWDLAFHTIALALVDPDFAKEQLVLLLREWYMHPNGQLPAYEWSLGDVNPPVHAWAALRVYKIERRVRGRADRAFLEKVFHKLLLNFTWWVNRKDAEGMNVFQGGFLGMDNIGVFNRSDPLPTGGYLEQSDGTSWMAMYCLNMLAIALELARENPAYEDVASKFFEHFVHIAHAMNNLAGEGVELWDEDDGFYYDSIHLPDRHHSRIKVRSMVGLVPLFAVHTLEPDIVDRLPGFQRRMQWFIDNHSDAPSHIDMSRTAPGGAVRRLLSIVSLERLTRVLRLMLDEREFLSPFGIRSMSLFHRQHPFAVHIDGSDYRVSYEPAESESGLFGGNSNWRGPIWFPVNYLLIESLQKFHHYFGDDLKVEFPTGSGQMLSLGEVAGEISRRLTRIFLRQGDGRRPLYGGTAKFQTDPHWRDLILFYEYFHGDNGAGLGASHTGWTGMVAKLIQQSGE